jgi:hypothetical protein
MKMLSEYLDHAISFERMANQETDPTLKAQLEKQPAVYRKLAAERAARYGLPLPSLPPPKDPRSSRAAVAWMGEAG